MLNCTLCATTRTICCILENFQTPEGVRIPEVLQTYMGGKDLMPFVRELPAKKKVVYVEWEDASAYHRWENIDDVTRTAFKCRSVGVVLERGEAGIVSGFYSKSKF